MYQTAPPVFVPILTIGSGTMNIDFYREAFGAVELRRVNNDDGSIHVAELSIHGAMFRVHEEVPAKRQLTPGTVKGSTITIGLVVEDVDAVVKSSIAAGAKELSSPQDYDYGYRQGEIMDPFGHCWMIEKRI